MNISDIGNNTISALICNTNSGAGGHHLGDWFSPTGDRVGGRNSTNYYVVGFFKRSNNGKVRLMKNSTGIPREGIYYCNVSNTTMDFQRLYVGLYNTTSGHGMPSHYDLSQC